MRFRLRLWPFIALFSVTVLVWHAGALGYLYVYDTTVVPKVPELPQTTLLFSGDGSTLAALHGPVDRNGVTISQIPRHMKQAVIAAEDQDFYKEGGVSWPSILRAAVVNVRERGLKQGGSTITQQYVKNRITGAEKSFSRKIKEAVLAQKLARRYSKDDILLAYLNNVYLGEGTHGVEAAARRYFSADVEDLTLGQAATLAGLIPAPELFDPIDQPEAARERRDHVLDRMAAVGFIDRETAEREKALPLKTDPWLGKPPRGTSYFVRHVTDELQRRFGADEAFGGGLRVYTTINERWQKLANKAVRDNLSAPGDPAAALVAIDPTTGAVKAVVGGRNFRRHQFNLATQGRRQTGSAFKAFTLAAAIKAGISLNSVWSGPSAITIGDPRCLGAKGPWQPHNYGDSSAGTMTLLDATAFSVNTIYAQLVTRVGPDKVAKTARRMGIRSELESVCSITLGSQSVTPLEMTSAFATLAADGVYREPVPFSSVTSPSEGTLFALDVKGKRALKPLHARLTTYALRSVVTRGTGKAAALNRPVAGKTGTAQNYHDAWFCGYVPQLATCVWMGYPKGQIPMVNVQGIPQVYGGSLPAAIWRDFMSAALIEVPAKDFNSPFPSTDTAATGSSYSGTAAEYGAEPTPSPGQDDPSPAPSGEAPASPAPTQPAGSPRPLPSVSLPP